MIENRSMKKEVRIMKKPQRRLGGYFATAKSIKTPSTVYQIPNTKYQSGSIALYLVMIIAILLMTTTTIAARLSIGELAQSSEVDLSDAAYYAAEAGIEEASRRLDVNDDAELEIPQIFPEQFANGVNGGEQHGDRAVLVNDSGSSMIGSSLAINRDRASQHSTYYGLVAWRQRKVYEEPINPFGNLVVDESVELDATNLRRECPEGSKNYRGADGWDCEGSPTSIFASFDGVKFCWTPSSGVNPDIEMTTISYPANNIKNITTEKMLINSSGGSGIHINFSDGGDPDGVYDRCASIRVNSKSRRYIFRIRPLHAGLRYRTELLDARNGNPGPLFLANNTVLIDSIGQVGEVRRRIIARKQRNGRILGIFDYVLYSGDPDLPLCKVGVNQDEETGIPGVEYDIDGNFCTVDPAEQDPPMPETTF